MSGKEEGESKVCFLCKVPGHHDIVTCAHCGLVNYCPDHGKIHRLDGVDKCMPYRISGRGPIIGRVLEAVSNVSIGQLVIVDKAAMIGPQDKPVCLGCMTPLQPESTVACPECRINICSLDCSRLDQHRHFECQIFKESGLRLPAIIDATKPHFVYNCVAILRLILARREAGTDLKNNFDTFMSHVADRDKDDVLVEALTRIAGFMRGVLKLDCVTLDMVKWSFGVLQTNSVGLPDPLLGRVVYPYISMMSHSCVPNLAATVKLGEGAVFKAQKPVSTGQEFTIRYTDWLECKLCTRRLLKENWMFDCSCPRCADPTDLGTFMSSPRCQMCRSNDGRGYYTPKKPLDHESDWECNSCIHLVSYQTILDMEMNGKNIVKESTDVLQTIDKLETIFWPSYHLVLGQKIKYVFDAGSKDKEKIVAFCQELLPIVNLLDGHLSSLKGQLGQKLGKISIEMLTHDMRSGKLSKPAYLEAVKPFIILQMQSKKLSL